MHYAPEKLGTFLLWVMQNNGDIVNCPYLWITLCLDYDQVCIQQFDAFAEG